MGGKNGESNVRQEILQERIGYKGQAFSGLGGASAEVEYGDRGEAKAHDLHKQVRVCVSFEVDCKGIPKTVKFSSSRLEFCDDFVDLRGDETFGAEGDFARGEALIIALEVQSGERSDDGLGEWKRAEDVSLVGIVIQDEAVGEERGGEVVGNGRQKVELSQRDKHSDVVGIRGIDH